MRRFKDVEKFCRLKKLNFKFLSKAQKTVILKLLPVFNQFKLLVYAVAIDIENDKGNEYDFIAMIDVPDSTAYISITTYGNVMLSFIDVNARVDSEDVQLSRLKSENLETRKIFRALWVKPNDKTLPELVSNLYNLIEQN